MGLAFQRCSLSLRNRQNQIQFCLLSTEVQIYVCVCARLGCGSVTYFNTEVQWSKVSSVSFREMAPGGRTWRYVHCPFVGFSSFQVVYMLEEPVLGPDKRITLQSIISHGDYSQT